MRLFIILPLLLGFSVPAIAHNEANTDSKIVGDSSCPADQYLQCFSLQCYCQPCSIDGEPLSPLPSDCK